MWVYMLYFNVCMCLCECVCDYVELHCGCVWIHEMRLCLWDYACVWKYMNLCFSVWMWVPHYVCEREKETVYTHIGVPVWACAWGVMSMPLCKHWCVHSHFCVHTKPPSLAVRKVCRPLPLLQELCTQIIMGHGRCFCLLSFHQKATPGV